MEFTQQESALLEVLAVVTSQDINGIKAAEIKLKEWEIQPGYYSTLLKIILNYSIDSNVRWLAASVFKNGVDKYWRKNAPNAIQEAEKISLRTDLMNTFGESVNAVAIQIAALISRIARFDCPKEWQELIPNLMEVIESDLALVQHRGLYTLNQVVKALASKRLPGDKRLFQSIAANIYSTILNYWNNKFKTFQFYLQTRNDDSYCQQTLANFLLSLKILQKLTVYGFKTPHECPEVMEFVNSIFKRLEDMFLIRKFMAELPWLSPLSEKVISHMTMVLVAFHENHPFSFVSFIHPSLTLVYNFIFKNPTNSLFQKFIIQCLNLMKAIIMCAEYKKIKCTGVTFSEYLTSTSAQARQVKNEFFKSEILEEVCTKLIKNFLPLNEEDFQLWEVDPEKFAIDDSGESWKFCWHPCSQSLYMALLHEYREIVTSIVLKLLQESQSIVDPQDLEGILKKDAIYTSVGLCAFDFYDEINFDEWFSSTLIHELGVKEPNYRILKRRIAWLIGKWTNVNSTELKTGICGAVIPLLSRDEDLVVRLTAAMALKSIVDSLEFTPDQFATFLGPSFSLLFTLLQEVEECSTKMQVLNVLSFIVERVGEDIKPYSQSLIQYLPRLWEESANHNMLKCVIVSTLVQFVKALVNENLASFLYPVIQCCTDFSSDARVYLLEDGLELWFTVLEHSSTLTPELFYLYRNMPTILENTSEHLECCCNIIQAYIILNPETFLAEYGESLITLCSSLMTDLNSKGIVKIMQIVETVLKANPQTGVKIALPLLVSTVINFCQEEHYTTLSFMYLSVICRVVLYSKEMFSQILEKAASVKNCAVESLLENVLLTWNKAMPLVPMLERKKLLALALSSLLTVQSNIILSQFSTIFTNLVEALNDIMDIDCLSADLNSLMLGEDNTAHNSIEGSNKIDRRRKQLDECDPVYLIELKGYLQSQFNELKNQVGPSNFESLLQTLDPLILKQCRLYFTL